MPVLSKAAIAGVLYPRHLSSAKTTIKLEQLQEDLIQSFAASPRTTIILYGNNPQAKWHAVYNSAKAVGKKVYRVDLQALVSKYIGETEKNLERVFRKAADKSWVLFFDEADALFGKRTEVKDAHDKYANQEVSYLMQQIEAYTGTIILSLKKALRHSTTVLPKHKAIQFS